MNESALEALRAAAGPDAVTADPDGKVRVAPTSSEAVAIVFGLAYDAGWRVAVEGAGTWQPDDAPAQVVVSLRALDQVVMVRPADLVVTAQCGVTLEDLGREALEHGTWLALDPPGRTERTIGSVLATATSGPLRHGFGPVRDHVLGLTVVTGDGRLIRAGGTTVKNVAGFDLVKLHVGGFGGFGVITECHLRLRGLPRADTTCIATGARDRLTAAARRLVEQRIELAALELHSPALATQSDWVLAARLTGGREAVTNEEQRLSESSDLIWTEVPTEQQSMFWKSSAQMIAAPPVTLRLGVVPEGVDETLDLLEARLDGGLISAGPAIGSIRWSGHADAVSVRGLRARLASREIPVTLERAPWELRRVVGHFGAYREGVGGLVSRLRETFDPHGVLVNALDGEGNT